MQQVKAYFTIPRSDCYNSSSSIVHRPSSIVHRPSSIVQCAIFRSLSTVRLCPTSRRFDLIASAVVRSAPGEAAGLALYSMGPYPLAALGAGRVFGELHWLQPAGYAALLSELEQYEGPEYRRVRHGVLSGKTPVDAWIFVGDPAQAAHLPHIPSGDWRAWRQRI